MGWRRRRRRFFVSLLVHLWQSHLLIERLDAGAKSLYDFADAADLVEFVLELVDLAQDLVEAGDFGIGHLDQVAGAVVLRRRRLLGLRVQLRGLSGQYVVAFQWSLRALSSFNWREARRMA